MNLRQLLWKSMVAVASVVTLASGVSAEVLSASIRGSPDRVHDYVLELASSHPVPFHVMDSAVFDQTAARPIAVSYTARCAIEGPQGLHWIDVDIYAINVRTSSAIRLRPTNKDDDALCVSVESGGPYVLQMKRVKAFASDLPPGRYLIRVLARARVPADSDENANGLLSHNVLLVWR